MTNKEQFVRLDQLIGQEKRESLASKTVAIFGLGGVGSAAALALARSGIGHFYLYDFDYVEPSNLNRQMLAFHSTIGNLKTDVTSQLIKDINPDAEVKAFSEFITEEWLESTNFFHFDFIIDAIDTIKSKIALIVKAQVSHIPLISAMGAGNRLDPSLLRIMDIYQTKDDPFAKIVRSQCRQKKIASLNVAISLESPKKNAQRTPASSPFVPPAMGLLIASHVVCKLINEV